MMGATSSASPATEPPTMKPFNWFLRRAMVAGAIGGVANALFLWIVGEPTVHRALAVEASRPSEGPEHAEMFTRGVQLAGGMLGALLYGLLLSTVFLVVFLATRHRVALRDDFQRSLALAGCAFATLGLLPALKYPANPPAVGNPDTINERTGLYLTFLAFGLLVAYAAWRAARVLRQRGWAQHERIPILIVGVVAAIAVGFALWPGTPDTIPADVPATVIWRFRVASLGGLAIEWATIGLVFGWLCTSWDPPRSSFPTGSIPSRAGTTT